MVIRTRMATMETSELFLLPRSLSQLKAWSNEDRAEGKTSEPIERWTSKRRVTLPFSDKQRDVTSRSV
jgi:hypothetical protein